MPLYEFLCDDCQKKKEFVRPIKEGPPKKVKCSSCHRDMRLNMDCNFVLKGGGWAGKEAKHGEHYHKEQEARNKWEAEEHDRKVLKKEHDEVLKHRRMGSKASKKHKEENKKMWERYNKRKRHAPPLPKIK